VNDFYICCNGISGYNRKGGAGRQRGGARIQRNDVRQCILEEQGNWRE